MIYLISGTPGTGKTSKAVQMMLDNEDGLFTFNDGSKRPIYVNHIDGLNYKALGAHELTDEDLQSGSLWDVVPEGSVVIVDECDYVYPTRSASKEVPVYIKTLKELRHHGLTLILLTQNGKMIDSYLRQLIGKHMHIERGQLYSEISEFNRFEENLSKTNLKLGAPKPYKPDKRTFKYYKSASIHVKHKTKKHWAFYVLPIVLAFLGYYAYQAYGLVTKGSETNNESQSKPVEQTASAIESNHTANTQFAGVVEKVITPSDFAPRIIDKPESAPIYDGFRQVKSMESIAGCVKTKKSCNCYSDQATKVNLPKGICEQILEDGIYNPYLPPPSERFVKKESNSEKVEFNKVIGSVGTAPPVDLMSRS